MAYTWTTEKASELVEERPLLYNIKDKKYRDRDLRSKALSLSQNNKTGLAEIASALDIPGLSIELAQYAIVK